MAQADFHQYNNYKQQDKESMMISRTDDSNTILEKVDSNTDQIESKLDTLHTDMSTLHADLVTLRTTLNTDLVNILEALTNTEGE